MSLPVMKITWYVDLSDTFNSSRHRFLIWNAKHRILFEWFSPQFSQGWYITCTILYSKERIWSVMHNQYCRTLEFDSPRKHWLRNAGAICTPTGHSCSAIHTCTCPYTRFKNILFYELLTIQMMHYLQNFVRGKIHLYSCATKTLFFSTWKT